MFKISIFWLSFVIVVDTLSVKPHMKPHAQHTLERSPLNSEEKYTAQQSDLQLVREKRTDKGGKKK